MAADAADAGLVKREAERLAAMSPPVAVREWNDRIARAYLEPDPGKRREKLDFNARLMTAFVAAGGRLR